MKKVWVLEKFVPVETTKKDIESLKKTYGDDKDPEIVEFLEKMVGVLQKSIDEHPEGHWVGYACKFNYRQFCQQAFEMIRQHRRDGFKFRVVKAEVEDDAGYWTGYKNSVENDGVLRYLYAVA